MSVRPSRVALLVAVPAAIILIAPPLSRAVSFRAVWAAPQPGPQHALGSQILSPSKWEYSFYEEGTLISWLAPTGDVGAFGGDWAEFGAKSQKGLGKFANSRKTVFQAVGLQGWELVSCNEQRVESPFAGRIETSFQCVFKRPVVE